MTFAWAEAKHGDNAEGWIKLTLLSLADIEMERIRGEQRKQEWSERYRI
jgi:hypothetical protein